MTRTMSMTGRRQDCILECLAENGPASRELIAQWLAGHGCHCSKATIVRDLQALAAAGLVESAGQGRAVRYAQAGAAGTPGKDFPVDTDAYFAEGPDSRELASETFNFDLLCQDPRLLTDEERAEADRCNERYRKSRAEMSECLLQKEYQRLVIELAWKSSKIEGCTYNLPEVEHLLREHVPSPARTRRETRIVLNHQKAMDYILEQPSHYRTLNHTKVEEIHSLLVSGLNVPKGVRHRTVCIGGTRYRPLDNFFQLEEALRGITDM
ncbi:MAG: hypothetical protein Q4F72_07310, partial [Desulfovibrionaceae bacterium]|nr:hypothetical protein [Desulfovibrionaceae bacterium]